MNHYHQQQRSLNKNMRKANLGMQLERLIEMANNKYRNAGIADVRKVPVNIKITEDYGRTVKGRKEVAEWVDYSGVYAGKPILFDAKETSNSTSFPLSNVKDHQYDILKSWHTKGAVTFLLVYFSKHNKYYLLPFEVLQRAWEAAKRGGRKSIEYKTIEAECKEIQPGANGYTLPYLQVLTG